tara:strand:- start:174 stop:572 length:399 start_codon:yes stop_codon:yes gene_type:complete
MGEIDTELRDLNRAYRNRTYTTTIAEFINITDNLKEDRNRLWHNVMDITTLRQIFSNDLLILFAEIRDRQTLEETKKGLEAVDEYEILPPLRARLENKIIEIIDLLQKISKEDFEDTLSRLAGKKKKNQKKT